MIFGYIYSTYAQDFIIKKINVTGNEKTKIDVILRELPFRIFDTIKYNDFENKLQMAKDNLLKTSLFNFVDIKNDFYENETVIDIHVEERWYYWIYPILEYADRNLSSFIYYNDFKRINYGAAFDWHNFRGKNELLRFKIRLGYKEQYSISYQKKGIGKKRILGLWTISEFNRQKKIISEIQENKPIYIEHLERYILNDINLGFGTTFRPKINYKINAGTIFKQTIIDNQQNFGDKSNTMYFIPKIKYEFDNRNSVIFPTSGLLIYTSFSANIGLNKFSNNYYTIASKIEYNKPVFKKIIFYQIASSHKQIFNYDKKIEFNHKLDFCSDNMIRGFEYYYLLSPVFYNIQNTVNFKISDFKIHYLPTFLPEKFKKTYTKVYLNVFFDAGFTHKSQKFYTISNPFNDKIIYSSGAGITIETYYDRIFQINAIYNANINNFGIFVEWKAPLYKLF